MPQHVPERLATFFAQRRHAALAVYLFGSLARGTEKADSDIDVAILFEQAPASTLEAQPFELQSELSEALGGRVDLVTLNCASADLVHRVLRDGHLVFEHDRSNASPSR